MLNRAAVILRYKAPAVEWINQANPNKESPDVTLASANDDLVVYLISDEDAESPDILKKWVKLNYKAMFENELMGWYVDEKLWPQKRTFNLFNQWFEVVCHSMLVDTVGSPIEDDEM